MIADLWNKDVDWPHGIAAVRAKLHQEHLAADKLVNFAALASSVIASCELRPDVCLFLHFAGYLDVGGVISLKDAFQSHGQAIPRKHLAVLGYTREINPPPAVAPLFVDTLLHPLEQTLEQVFGKHLASQKAVADDQRVSAVIFVEDLE